MVYRRNFSEQLWFLLNLLQIKLIWHPFEMEIMDLSSLPGWIKCPPGGSTWSKSDVNFINRKNPKIWTPENLL